MTMEVFSMKNLKKLMSLLVVFAFAFTMVGCSVNLGGGGGYGSNRTSIEIGKTSSDYDQYTIQIGDTLAQYGIRNGSTVKVKYDSRNGITLSFDLIIALSQTTRDAVVDSIEKLIKDQVGQDVKVRASSLEVISNQTHLKFDITFKL